MSPRYHFSTTGFSTAFLRDDPITGTIPHLQGNLPPNGGKSILFSCPNFFWVNWLPLVPRKTCYVTYNMIIEMEHEI